MRLEAYECLPPQLQVRVRVGVRVRVRVGVRVRVRVRVWLQGVAHHLVQRV